MIQAAISRHPACDATLRSPAAILDGFASVRWRSSRSDVAVLQLLDTVTQRASVSYLKERLKAWPKNR